MGWSSNSCVLRNCMPEILWKHFLSMFMIVCNTIVRIFQTLSQTLPQYVWLHAWLPRWLVKENFLYSLRKASKCHNNWYLFDINIQCACHNLVHKWLCQNRFRHIVIHCRRIHRWWNIGLFFLKIKSARVLNSYHPLLTIHFLLS